MDSVERKLAAILAADVVGYSRLMEADEEGTLARLKTLRREFVDPKIAGHRGRIVKLMGDGVLVEFASVVGAVRCAVEIQRGMAERNSNQPDDQRIAFRIGVNLGDVIIDDDDIYGGGVNVAARLESLAEPGGILTSGTTYDQIEGRVDCGFEFIGEKEVKNIEQPVRAYRVLLDESARVAPARLQRWVTRKKYLRAVASVALVLVVGFVGWLQPWKSADETTISNLEPLDLPAKPSSPFFRLTT